MKRKIVAIILAGTMAMSFTACGSSSSANTNASKTSESKEVKKEAAKQDATITESGYYISDDGMGDVYAYYGIAINNPNAGFALLFPTVTITAKGEDGSMQSGDFVSGDTTGVIPSSSFAVSNTNEIVQDYGSVSYTGEITNNSDSDIDMVAVTVILKNNGAIVYGDTTYVDNLSAGSTRPFEISEYNLPEHSEYVISVQSW